jgi:hypothetical protein
MMDPAVSARIQHGVSKTNVGFVRPAYVPGAASTCWGGHAVNVG